jgi:hypothetical protein
MNHQRTNERTQKDTRKSSSSSSSTYSIPPRPVAHTLEGNPMAPIMNLPNDEIPVEHSICKHEKSCKRDSCRYVHDRTKLRPPPSFTKKHGVPNGISVTFVDWTGSDERVFQMQSERFYPSKYLRAIQLNIKEYLPPPRICHK